MAWAKANKAAEHYDVSVRTLREWQKQGFPHVKIRGSVLFDLDRGDEWLRENFTVEGNAAQAVVDELLRDL